MHGRGFTAVIVVSGAFCVSVLAAYWWFSRYGLDYSDEGYYLNWLSKPGNYPASTTQFGFVYHPLYLLLGGDIALLRAVNVTLVVGLAWLAAHQLLARLVGWRPEPAWPVFVCSAGLATTGTCCFSLGLLTPNYNTLALQGLLVTVTGVVVAVAGAADERSWWVGWAVIGSGGWLTLMAKPTTALALALLVTATIMVAGAGRIRGFLVAGLTATALVVGSALAIDGSVGAFVRRLESGAEMAATLGGDHQLGEALRWDPYDPSALQVVVLLAVAAAVSLAGLAGALRSTPVRLACAAGSVAALVLAFVATRGDAAVFVWANPFSASLSLSVPLAAVALLAGLGGGGATRRLGRAHWAMIGLFTALPHVFAFGTNNNYWRVAGQAAVFWVLLAVVVLAPLAGRVRFRWAIAPVVLASQVLAVLVVLPALSTPYRQPGPVWDYDTPTRVRGSTLLLHPEAARHVTETTSAVRTGGLERGQAMLDLTGRSPGMLYAWGADSLVQPWSIGGYSGSARQEALALARVPCRDLATMWLLTEPDGPRHIPDEILSAFGADLDDFEVRASWIAPVAITRDTAQPQQVWAPVRDDAAAEASCLQSRRTAP